ncbi:MAG: glutathione S-transferase family protein [Steroidobacteraceae bacterium]
MILIGMFDSPFVRRVAVSMNLLGIAFEHRSWSVGKDLELIRQYNSLGRVPTLVQPDGEALIESSAILDFLDECAGADRALLPRSGQGRREARRLRSVANNCRNLAASKPIFSRRARKLDQPFARCVSTAST